MMDPTDDVLIHNGRLVLPNGVKPGTLSIRAGLISAIGEPGVLTPARRTIDAKGCYVVPGFIDSHVHFRTPGLTHKEDWQHASRAAAAGGVTTVLDMPNTNPPLLYPKQIAERVEMLTGSSLVDFGFHLGADPERPQSLDELQPNHAASIKVFMAGHHTAPHVVRTPATLANIFERAAARGLRIVLHAEDDGIFALLDSWRPPVATYSDFEPSRPRTGAIVAVARIIELVRRYGTQAHILHVSSQEEVDLLCAARCSGLPLTFEVTAHHLSFSDHESPRLGSRIRLSPAIRQPADRERLWRAVLNAEVTTIGSDHAPHTLDEKLRPPASAPPGIPGVQELISAVYTGLRQRVPSGTADDHVALLVRLAARNPATLFGMGHIKGQLAPGYQADIAVFDNEQRWCMRASDVLSKCGWSAYEGWTMTGRVVLTLRRGEPIWSAETNEFGKPRGEWIGAHC
jgi:dihydroorotase